jgi:hypothetical protein
VVTGAEEAAQRERLIGALAQCAPAAYMDNPEFHAAVHQLAAMLPAMVLGLAVECQRSTESRRWRDPAWEAGVLRRGASARLQERFPLTPEDERAEELAAADIDPRDEGR